MKQNCKFNPIKDIEQAMPGLSVDLSRAIVEGVIKDTGELPYHNEIEDPKTITGRVSDVFEAIDADRALKSRMKSAVEQVKANKSKQPEVSSGTATATTQE